MSRRVFLKTFGWPLDALLHADFTCFEGHI